MDDQQYHVISGQEDGERLDSRILEELIQTAVEGDHTNLKIEAYGQHGIGGRLWKTGTAPVRVRIEGHPGQRIGSNDWTQNLVSRCDDQSTTWVPSEHSSERPPSRTSA